MLYTAYVLGYVVHSIMWYIACLYPHTLGVQRHLVASEVDHNGCEKRVRTATVAATVAVTVAVIW